MRATEKIEMVHYREMVVVWNGAEKEPKDTHNTKRIFSGGGGRGGDKQNMAILAFDLVLLQKDLHSTGPANFQIIKDENKNQRIF